MCVFMPLYRSNYPEKNLFCFHLLAITSITIQLFDFMNPIFTDRFAITKANVKSEQTVCKIFSVFCIKLFE